MKLDQLQEARYTGDHPIVKKIKIAMASGERGPISSILNSEQAKSAERGIFAAFGQPDEQDPGSITQYRNMVWNFDNKMRLWIIDGITLYKGDTILCKKNPNQTYMEISLV